MRDFRRLSFHTRTKHRKRMNWNRFVASRVLLCFVSAPVILIFITQASYFEVGVRIASPFNNPRLSRTEESYILMFLVLAFIIASSTSSVACCLYSLRKNSFLLSIEFVFDGKASVVESTESSANADAIRTALRTGAHKVLCFRLWHKASWHASWYNSFNAAAYRFNCVCLSIDSFFFFTVYLNICFLMLLCVCLCLPFISQLEG